MNTQAVEKVVNEDGTFLDLHSIFLTVQGEGPYSGQRAVFIRLAGCNLQCPGCDTDYTSGRRKIPVDAIRYKVQQLAKPPHLVVITGGEPFRQNISPLANHLVGQGYNVQVETNGTLPPSDYLHKLVTIVCSPKTGSVNPVMLERAECFKYVLHSESIDPEDGLPVLVLDHSAKPRVARPRVGAKVFIQPMDSGSQYQNFRNRKAAVDSCLKFGYTLQLQIHKILGVE